MAETHHKRHREDAGDTQPTTPKRHRTPYTEQQQESPEQDTTQDLLDFFTNLSSDPFLDFAQNFPSDADNNSPSNTKEESIDEDDEKERVIRHLLEASDDELGIPTRVDGTGDGDGDAVVNGGGDDEVAGGSYESYGDLSVGLWELEDEAANYYTLLQSELFMQ